MPVLAGMIVLALSGCAQTTETALRARLGAWFDLGATQYFQSRMSCTVAVLDLGAPSLPDFAVATDEPSAVVLIARGLPLMFDLGGISPNAISQRLMSADLGAGLGILSAGVGPAKDCISDDRVAAGYAAALLSTDTRTLYLPSQNALLLVHLPERLIFYLRGAV